MSGRSKVHLKRQTRISQSTQVKSASSMAITSPPLALQVLITRHMHSAAPIDQKEPQWGRNRACFMQPGFATKPRINLQINGKLQTPQNNIRLKRLLGNKTIQRRHGAFEMATTSKTQFRYTMFQFKMFEQNWGRLGMPQVLYSTQNIQYHNFQRS